MTRLQKTIVLLPGDGIGPEVTRAAAQVLGDCAREFGHSFTLVERPIGGAAIDLAGSPFPEDTARACLSADAILLGAVGGGRWDSLPVGRRPESGLLELRRRLGLYANLRPVRLHAALGSISPLRPERARRVDLEIVRELSGGIYFGERGRRGEGAERSAFDTESYSAREIERVARVGFARARGRRRRLASVDKANVLESSQLWRGVVNQLAGEFPEVELEHLYVDNAALQLVLDPSQFDVILTSNLFGDILSDEAAGLAGSIGLMPSASFGSGPSLYEPIHGSAPGLAGKDCACPIGAILSAAMLVRESFGLAKEADAIELAVARVLESGLRTPDIAVPGAEIVGLAGMTEAIRHHLVHALLPAEGYGWGV